MAFQVFRGRSWGGIHMKRFRHVWRFCSRQGWCDELGGGEYRRVLVEWHQAGFPEHLVSFIRERANGVLPEPV